jgi:TIGR02646 family protein
MHKLDRTTVTPPACLCNNKYHAKKWDKLESSDRKAIIQTLCKMQGNRQLQEESDQPYIEVRCAYCEDIIYVSGDKHIEHFCRRSDFSELTFDWDNLFLSCESKAHCGHYKDRRKAPSYNPNDLIKPDIDDPDDFLFFHSNGEVHPRPGISAATQRKAEKTIRVFHLDEKKLQGQRSRVVESYLKGNSRNDLLALLKDSSPADREAFFIEEFEAEKWKPFPTTLRHFLTCTES